MVSKKQILWLIGLICIIIISTLLFLFLNQLAGLIAFILGFIGIYISIFSQNSFKDKKYKKELEETTNALIEKNREIKKLQKKSKNLERKKSDLKDEKLELEKILKRMNYTLKKENISKEELIEKIDTPLRMILLMKTSEDIPNKRFILRDNALPELGFKYFDKGIYVLPPTKTPQLNNKKEIKSWLKDKLAKYIDKDYEYIIQMATVVDLRKIYFEKNVPEFRNGLTIIDALSPEDLIPAYKVLKYLRDRKNISLFDILNIPSIPFLVNEGDCSRAEYERLRKNNDQIIDRISRLSKIKPIKTLDLATMDEKIIELALTRVVKNPDELTDIVKENAQFWKNYFEGKNN